MKPRGKIQAWFWVGIAALLPVPWFVIFFFQWSLAPIPQTVLSGLAVVGAAFLLSWIAEVAQYEISRSLTVAFVAIAATLPEYSVDIYIAARAGHDPAYVPFAVANMTGANRLLIGVAWAMVVFIWWIRSRKNKVKIDQEHGFEFALLFLITLYSLLIPLKKTLSILDGAILFGFFLFYIRRASQEEIKEPEVEEFVSTVVTLSRPVRRFLIAFVFAFALAAIALAVKPFTEGLISSGRLLRMEGFVLIQLFAPLASEAPEFIVAGILALRRKPSLAMATLISAKLNQWTLLVGMVPIIYSFSLFTGGHSVVPFPLSGRQIDEMVLTSAQSFFAVALLADFNLSLFDAVTLFLLYTVQFLVPSPHSRYIFALIYLLLGIMVLTFKKANWKGLKSHLLKISGSR